MPKIGKNKKKREKYLRDLIYGHAQVTRKEQNDKNNALYRAAKKQQRKYI